MVENKHIYKYNLTFKDYFMKTLLTIQFRIIATVVSLFFVTFGFYAQTPGNIDLSFDVGNGITVNEAFTRCLALQSDGKILVGGNFTSYDGYARNSIVRLNADGTVDTSFNSGSGLSEYSSIYAITVQPDGKILVGGSFTSYNGQSKNLIVRLNSNGDVDTSFDIGTGFSAADYANAVHSIVVQPDGKIIIGGYFISYNGQPAASLIRLNANGSIDTSFDIGAGIKYYSVLQLKAFVYDIHLQDNGKIIIGGNFNKFNDEDIVGNVVRLNADGSLDNSFGITEGVGVNAIVFSVGVQSDSKVLAGGTQFIPGEGGQINIVRFNEDGSLDSTFDIGTGLEDENQAVIVEDLVIQSDGKIIIGGSFSNLNGQSVKRIARLNSDGTQDTTFDSGMGFNARLSDLLLQPDGKIVAGGQFSLYNGQPREQVTRLNTNGNIDNLFDVGGGIQKQFIATAYDVTIQPDGKILVAGDFSHYDNYPVGGIVRVNDDGSRDNSFQVGGGFIRSGGIRSNVYKIKVQSDGKILVGGDFIAYNDQSTFKMVRLNADGTLDTTFEKFNLPSYNWAVRTFDSQLDGKIIVGRQEGAPYLYRYNADGSIDNTFDIGTGVNGTVSSIVTQPDGKVLVCGNFTEFNGQPQNRIMRLNPDGSLDTSFDVGTGIGNDTNRLTIALQPDGKILVGAPIHVFNGENLNYKRIIRLNPDGSLDTSFEEAISTGGGSIQTISVQPDGKIIVGGFFGGVLRNFTRLNSDGSVDSSFLEDVGFNASGNVYRTAIQTDEKILVVGAFIKYNTHYRNGILRLHGDATADVEDFENSSALIDIYPNPTKDYFNIISEDIIQSIELYDIAGRLIKTELVNGFEVQQNVSSLASGTYILKVKTEKAEITKKIIKE